MGLLSGNRNIFTGHSSLTGILWTRKEDNALEHEKSVLNELADFTAGIDCNRLPDAVRAKTRYCILDALECCLNGSREDPRTTAAWEYVKDRAGGAAAFARRKKLRSSDAAFYHGVTGAVSSRNDISKAGSCHPGSVVVPVALALAQAYGSDGKQVMEGVLAGYEAMIRLGIALRQSPMPGAFRSTAVLAPFGAAFTAAKVLGLSPGQTANAASFACHSAGGFNNWVSEGTGEDALQNGWGARNGLEAALLARTGLPAARYILEHKEGFLAAFSASGQKNKITEELGHRWHILDVSFKPMCSCLKLTAPCQIAKKLFPKVQDWRQIRQIRIGVAQKTLEHPGTAEIHVNSQVQAIMSIPFGVASVLTSGDCRNIRWYPPYRESVLELMKRCKVEAQPALTSQFPHKRGAQVIIERIDGTEIRLFQEDAEGLEERDVETLFTDTMTEFYGADQAAACREIILSLENRKSLDDLFERLA